MSRLVRGVLPVVSAIFALFRLADAIAQPPPPAAISSPIPRGTLDPGAPVVPLDDALREVEQDRIAAPVLERYQAGDYEGAVKLGLALVDRGGSPLLRFAMANSLAWTGRYDEALTHLNTAAAQYPRDRVVLGQIGRVQFLQRKFTEAVASFERVLAVDPEDLLAHYNLMLCYQGLGDQKSASRERTLYERFKADEASQAITGPYRQLHPDDNRERQPIHEHGQR